MPIDPAVLSEAKVLVAQNGMTSFVPQSSAPLSTGGQPIAIALIDPVARRAGTPNFDKPDPHRPGLVRSADLLRKIRDGVPLEPVLLFNRPGGRYHLHCGFHRFHLCAALGYTHIHATVTSGEF